METPMTRCENQVESEDNLKQRSCSAALLCLDCRVCLPGMNDRLTYGVNTVSSLIESAWP
jgi:hypothetical protein